MAEKKEDIKKPWCTYNFGIGPAGVGRIEKDSKSHVLVRDSEGQMYPLECWDPQYVKRFATLDEAVEEYIKYGADGESPRDRMSEREYVKLKFPSYFKEKKELTARLATVIDSLKLKRTQEEEVERKIIKIKELATQRFRDTQHNTSRDTGRRYK